jgi:hypothetical protein
MWAVKPTGDYAVDYQTGKEFAFQFLESNDRTYGWTTMLTEVVGDMIRADEGEKWRDGRTKMNGVVIGFLNTLGKLLSIGALARGA